MRVLLRGMERESEEMLVGKPAGAETFERAAEAAVEGANPLPMTGYKVLLVRRTVLETLNRASGRDRR